VGEAVFIETMTPRPRQILRGEARHLRHEARKIAQGEDVSRPERRNIKKDWLSIIG